MNENQNNQQQNMNENGGWQGQQNQQGQQGGHMHQHPAYFCTPAEWEQMQQQAQAYQNMQNMYGQQGYYQPPQMPYMPHMPQMPHPGYMQAPQMPYGYMHNTQYMPPMQYAQQTSANNGIASFFNFKDERFIKGAITGAALTFLLTNEPLQKNAMKSAVKFWNMLQGGVAEMKERIQDIDAEIKAEEKKQAE